MDAQTQTELHVEPVELYLQEVASLPRLPSEFRTKNVKAQFQFAFELIGGIPRLAHWAHTHPSQFYALYSKLIPASISAPNGGPIQIQLSWLDGRDTRGQTNIIDLQTATPEE